MRILSAEIVELLLSERVILTTAQNVYIVIT